MLALVSYTITNYAYCLFLHALWAIATRILCTDCLPVSSPPHEASSSHLAALNAVQFRAYIEIKVQTIRVAIRVLLPLVEVDNVLDRLSTAALDDPVMPIKRGSVTH